MLLRYNSGPVPVPIPHLHLRPPFPVLALAIATALLHRSLNLSATRPPAGASPLQRFATASLHCTALLRPFAFAASASRLSILNPLDPRHRSLLRSSPLAL
ncbi:hypothetical protein NW759_000627 [Fusarium solani]|nr:hypothetical protein NW759_000627 [Fusarium solani]